jgi:hypothetical protein
MIVKNNNIQTPIAPELLLPVSFGALVGIFIVVVTELSKSFMSTWFALTLTIVDNDISEAGAVTSIVTVSIEKIIILFW